MKQFYSHLIGIESIIIELDKLGLSNEQKIHLSSLIDSSLHHIVLDAVLSELSSLDKKAFLNHLQEGQHERIWQFLNERVDDIEGKIRKAAADLLVELHKDIKEANK